MAEQNATPPLPLDAAAIQKMIADAVKPISDALKPLADNQKVLADTIAADTAAKAEAAKAADAAKKAGAGAGDPPKPLTAEEISKLVQDGVAAQLKAQAEASKGDQARNAFIGEKLKDVPAAYHAKLGSDPTKWGAEEQAIREGLKADLATLGFQAKDVSGGNAGGQSGSSNAGQQPPAGSGSLTAGQAAFAQALKIPS